MTAPSSKDKPELWRLFCAITMPDDVSRQLTRLVSELRTAFPKVKASWNRDGQFHLTVKFIGETPESHADSLSRAAARATTGIAPFNLVVRGTGAFPVKGPPRVLWAGIEDNEERLRELHKRLDNECEHEGFVRDARPLHPHLTLARIRDPKGTGDLTKLYRELEFQPVTITVAELCVIRSELSPRGSRYTDISRHLLAG